ncbi:hypothetical protein PC9H_000599 [Pleurotus ostreatus]|uniref:Uncharacterized protein n=1 Tax=Pleurotus ostreatus TaxID=5322 RepID=A0A8H7DWZ3_PLEOS|nr:uncharacterized protein PC9H_000599 [Pleurotus ostreatus]KAF7440255.1 hypothetical protein PC9H_000599 [Pleurotus ostreatus]
MSNRIGARLLPFEPIHHIVEALVKRNGYTLWHLIPLYVERGTVYVDRTSHLLDYLSDWLRVGHLSAQALPPFYCSPSCQCILNLHLLFDEDDVTSAAEWLPDYFERLKNLRYLHVECYAAPLPALQTLGIVPLLAIDRIKRFDLECHDPELSLEEHRIGICAKTSIDRLFGSPPQALPLRRIAPAPPKHRSSRGLDKGLHRAALGDYGGLYRMTEPLHKRGSLKRVELDFLPQRFDVELSCGSESEVAKVQAFAPLLEGGQLVVDIRV